MCMEVRHFKQLLTGGAKEHVDGVPVLIETYGIERYKYYHHY